MTRKSPNSTGSRRFWAVLIASLLLVGLLPAATALAAVTCLPSSGPAAGGTVVTVSGAPLGTFSVATTVTGFASPASVIPTTVVADGTGFTFVSGTNTSGPHALSTTSPAAALCSFLSLDPAGTMTLGTTSGSISGGTSVALIGTGTAWTAGSSVTVGGTAAATFAFVDATHITITTPARATIGAVDVVVTTPTAFPTTATAAFTYTSTAPTVTGVSPSSGSTAGGTAVTITGTGFVSGATITIGGTAATSVVFVGSTSLTAVTPAHAAGLVNVVVTNPDTNSGTGTGLYTYLGPTVTGVSPSSGTTAGGTAVTITGTGFVSGATITFGGTAATSVVFGSATSLTAVTPAHAAGLVNVVVTNPNASTGTGTGLYTYLGLTVTGVSPSSGSTAGGTAVTITGTGFVSGATITFGGTAATSVVFVSSTSLTAVTPAHAAGLVNVVVTNPDASSGTGTGLYTYLAGPTVTINQAAGQPDPTSASPINFSVVFSVTVTGFTTGDVTISGTAGGTKTATVTGSGTTYNVAVTGMTTAGTVIATIPAGVATNASSETNLASTSTDNTVNWLSVATGITLTNSAAVITWGGSVVLTVQFGANGANRTFLLEGARDGITWTTRATLTTNASGLATFTYRPAINQYYRARFLGTADLAAATSNTTRTTVRQIALLRPTNLGAIKSIARNTSITFTTTARPARPELPRVKVSFVFYRRVSGVWTRMAKRDVIINSLGKASTTFKFTTAGSWYVRTIANPTPYNANSVWSPLERYTVR